MNLDDLPFVRAVHRAGTEDVIFDVLMLLGPAILVCIALVGRTAVTTAPYIGAVVLYVLYTGLKTERG